MGRRKRVRKTDAGLPNDHLSADEEGGIDPFKGGQLPPVRRVEPDTPLGFFTQIANECGKERGVEEQCIRNRGVDAGLPALGWTRAAVMNFRNLVRRVA